MKGLSGGMGTGCNPESKEGATEGFQRREWHGQFCVLERSLARSGKRNQFG